MSGAHAYGGGWNRRSIYVLAVLTLIYTFNYVDRQILALVLPQIKSEMHLSDTMLGLISGFVFVLFYSLLGVPIAWLADRSNRRNILAFGVTFWSLMTALTGAVTNVWQLAATRFLMGAGEATGVAPSTSIVSDMFDKASRPLALAILASGSSLAALIFFPIAGWISQNHGWRVTYYCAGAAGIALGVLLFLTVREPMRGLTGAVKPVRESFSAAARFLAGSSAYLTVVAGGAFMGVSLYAAQIWNPSFLTRVHHLNMAEVGAAIGLLRGAAGLVGTILGGLLADRLGRLDERWRLWTPGIACVLILPAELVFLLAPSIPLSLFGLGITGLFTAMHFGPIYAACQNLARPTMRAQSAALYLLVGNMVGQIVGPLAVGMLNDYWRAEYGDGAIRYSLILGAACGALAGLFMIVAAFKLPRDTARAET